MGRTLVKKNISNKLKSQAGFSLAGVMVAAAMLAVITVALTKVIQNGQQGQKAVNDSVDFSVLKGNIQTVLENRVLCRSAFRAGGGALQIPNGAAGALINVGQIAIGGTQIAANPLVIGSGLSITRLQLQRIAANVATGTDFNFQARLLISVTKANGGYGGNVLSTNQNNAPVIDFRTDGAGNILDCGANSLPIGCAAGQYVVAGANGTTSCQNLPPLPPIPPTSCGGGQILAANSVTGVIECTNPPVIPVIPPIPSAPPAEIMCPNGQVLSGVAGGNYQCKAPVPPGSFYTKKGDLTPVPGSGNCLNVGDGGSHWSGSVTCDGDDILISGTPGCQLQPNGGNFLGGGQSEHTYSANCCVRYKNSAGVIPPTSNGSQRISVTCFKPPQ